MKQVSQILFSFQVDLTDLQAFYVLTSTTTTTTTTTPSGV